MVSLQVLGGYIMNKDEKAIFFAKQKREWEDQHGDYVMKDPHTGKWLTETDIEDRKLKARIRGNALLKRLGVVRK